MNSLGAVVETSGGKIRGAVSEGVYSFRGIPYGADTGGDFRFQPARPMTWAGVRDALVCGPRAPQNEPPTSLPYLTWLRDGSDQGEDCLALNVFTSTTDGTSRRPVMVYLHGGGFSSGSGGAPGVDGSNLASGGAVVVTLNHRLNLFGYLHLREADGGRYRDAGNVGMLDLVAALQWVQQNIGRFGGDPGNVTLFGQSGGGSKVAVLMAMPVARGLFHKAIIQSASSLLALATEEQGDRNTFHFLAALGLDRSTVGKLHDIPAERLLAAMPEAVKAGGSIDNFRPVVDGHILPSQPFSPASRQSAVSVPLMIGWCENEQRLAFAPHPDIYRQSKSDALACTAEQLGVAEDEAASLFEVYRSGRPNDSPGDIYAHIYGDHRYRRNVTRAAERQVLQGGAPVYMYLLDWKTPVLDGLLRTPHTLCIAFAFGNVDVAAGITGVGDDRYALQQQMSAAWLEFARAGNPHHQGLPVWRPYSVEARSTMLLGRNTRLVDDPAREERIALDAYPPYSPAAAEGRLLTGAKR